LLSTTPEAGSIATTAPTEVSLDFSGNLISGQGIQNLVTVTDEAGHQWQDGDAQVAGPALTSALCEGMPNGDYEVDYRVVYSDGHSEAKKYGFTLDDPAAPETGAPQDCGVPNPDAPVSSDQDPTSAGAGSTDAATGATTGASSGTEPAPATATAPAADATDPAGTPTTEATTESTGIASDVPTWVWVVGVLGVLGVAAAVAFVFRRARAIDRPDIDRPDIDGPAGGRPGSED
jgi:methionine-rich copper-binding protein CopC